MLQPYLVSVTPQAHYKLKLVYETGEQKIFDVSPYISGEWYAQLKCKPYFNQVKMLEGGYGIEWPNGQDIAPHELYDDSTPIV